MFTSNLLSAPRSCVSHSRSVDGGWDKFHKKWPLIIFVSFGYLLKILLFHQSHDHYSAALIAVCFSSISSIALSLCLMSLAQRFPLLYRADSGEYKHPAPV